MTLSFILLSCGEEEGVVWIVMFQALTLIFLWENN
jgi:hypothetical protein